MALQHITVIGAGTMGNGIAHVFAQSGFPVVLVDVNPAQLEKALQTITRNFDRQIGNAFIQTVNSFIDHGHQYLVGDEAGIIIHHTWYFT